MVILHEVIESEMEDEVVRAEITTYVLPLFLALFLEWRRRMLTIHHGTCSHLAIAIEVTDEVNGIEAKDGAKDHVRRTADPHAETTITTAVEITETGNENANMVDENEAENEI